MTDAEKPHYREIENDLMAAIAADLESIDDEPVTVTSYLVVAEVMDADGGMSTKWTCMDGVPYYRSLGMAEWLKINVIHAMTHTRDE